MDLVDEYNELFGIRILLLLVSCVVAFLLNLDTYLIYFAKNKSTITGVKLGMSTVSAIIVASTLTAVSNQGRAG